MIKLLLSLLLIIHGALHALGFIKAFNFAPLKEMSGIAIIPLSPKASRCLGLVWLVPGLILIITAVTLILNFQFWWLVALVGIVLSQGMIILYWKDAYAGSFANLLVVIGYLVLTYTKLH